MMTQTSGYLVRAFLTGGIMVMTCALSWSQQAAIVPPGSSPNHSPDASSEEDKRTAKQKLLDGQAQRLASVAAELKVEVDKTNKNILSLHVVRKAEEIEALARTMKDQNKR